MYKSYRREWCFCLRFYGLHRPLFMQMPPIGIDFGGNKEAALDYQLCSL